MNKMEEQMGIGVTYYKLGIQHPAVFSSYPFQFLFLQFNKHRSLPGKSSQRISRTILDLPLLASFLRTFDLPVLGA